VAVTLQPEDYDFDETAPDGSAWELFGDRYPRNPRLLVTPESEAMVTIWSMWRGGGFGSGHLPDAGGSLDQPAIMLDAFGIMEAAAKELDD